MDKKAEKSRVAHRISGGGVEAHGQLMLSANVRCPGTKYKRSKIDFSVTSIVFTVVNICTELL